MDTTGDNADMDRMQVKLSTLWVFLLVNMIFADIFGFMTPGFFNGLTTASTGQVEITEGFLLLAAMVTEIPIAMVVLSRLLNQRANRRANISAGAVTIAFVIGGGSTTLHYIFFATIEIVCALCIMISAWKWPDPARQALSQENNFATQSK